MKLKLSNLKRWDGEISRGPFLIWAAVLFALKYSVDRVVLKVGFNHDWSILEYFKRPVPWLDVSPAKDPAEPLTLLAFALPFLWMGVVLCLKRLRSAKLPLWLVVLFVVPVLKWFLFMALALVPPREREKSQPLPNRSSQLLRWFPKSSLGSAAIAIVLSTLLGAAATALGTEVLKDYGWALFTGVPFCLGFFAAVIHAVHQPRRLRESVAVSLLAVSLVGAVLLVVALEGLICILMAAPLALGLALVGGLVGHAVQVSRWQHFPSQLLCLPVLAIPAMLVGERYSGDVAPLLRVSTTVEVNASPEQVWTNVVRFARLPPPRELLFQTGIAYPVQAEIRGCGPGAIRHCVFSTGSFVEPIEVWDEPRLLAFAVTENPAPMEEWTPYREIHPPHLHGFLVSRRGQFLLTPLPGGRTKLEGTTWYEHRLWPAKYWQLWSDQIIHTIHRRVLTHVKALSEQAETSHKA